MRQGKEYHLDQKSKDKNNDTIVCYEFFKQVKYWYNDILVDPSDNIFPQVYKFFQFKVIFLQSAEFVRSEVHPHLYLGCLPARIGYANFRFEKSQEF